MRWADVYVPHVSPASMSPVALDAMGRDAMGRRLRSPRLPGVDVPGVDASMSPRPQPRRAMRWADVYVCMLADGVALRNRCPQGQADPRAAIDGGASGVTMARAGPHRDRRRRALWAASPPAGPARGTDG